MRCTPIASVMVMIAGSPSGIAATASPTTAMNASASRIATHQTAEHERETGQCRSDHQVSRARERVHLPDQWRLQGLDLADQRR